MRPDEQYPDGPYRPSHWPSWARDEIFTHADVRFGWLDRLLILIGRPVSLRVETIVGNPPVRCASQTSIWAHRIRWPWQRQPGGYSEMAAPAPSATPSTGAAR